ncbi:MAG: hypothetical protein ACRDHX_16575 [Chloroflexota bacterium]
MAIVVLHNGHLNVDRNPDAGLHGETGAQGELEWIVRLQDALQARLEAAGHAVKRTDGSGPRQDFGGDLFIANHYDGGAPKSSHCMAAHALNDTTPAESERLLRCFLARYPGAVGIPAHQELVSANMTRYYGFAYEAQPDLIVEHGNNSNAHDHAILHGQLELVVQATFDVIQDYFGPHQFGTNSDGGASMPKANTNGAAAKPLYHYLLWADSFQFRLPQAQAYLDRFKASNGWSVDDAAQAQHVTIVGPGHLLVDVEQRLKAAGASLERIAGDDTAAPFAELLARDARFVSLG